MATDLAVLVVLANIGLVVETWWVCRDVMVRMLLVGKSISSGQKFLFNRCGKKDTNNLLTPAKYFFQNLNLVIYVFLP